MDENTRKSDHINELNAKLYMANKQVDELSKAPSSKKKRVAQANNPITLILRDTVKEKVWRSLKFVSSDKQMKQLAIITLKASGIYGKFDENGQLTQDGIQFIEDHASEINTILNEHRSNCQTAMKDVCMAYMKNKNLKEMPSDAEFMKIIERSKDVDKDLFAWWWEEYMPKAAGSAKIWNKKLKYYGRLSDHAPPNNPYQVYITPSTEAWGLLLILNCRQRWPKLLELKAKSSDRITYVTSAKKGTEKAGTIYIDLHQSPEFQGKYTKSDSGQKQFGGWSTEGLKKYTELMKKNKEARAKMETTVLEEEILGMLRKKNGIKGNTAEENEKFKSGNPNELVVDEEIEDLFDMDEYEDITSV